MALSPLTLVLEFARAEQAEDPWAFRFAPQVYLLRTAGGGFERANFPWDEALLSDLEAMRRPGWDPAVLARLGERLRRFVTPLGWPELAAQVVQASDQGRRVLLTIRSAAAELYSLPWELLTLKASGQHVGELAEVLLRYEWPETATKPENPLPRRGGGRILVAWSAADGAVPAAEHVRAVTEACVAGFHPFDPVGDVLANASLGRLSDMLSAAKREGRPISVLHLLCHGGQVESTFGLVLDGEPGQPGSITVDAGRLRQVLGQHADMVRLVVLMACDSGNTGLIGNQMGSVAQTLHRAGIAAVVASRYPLSVAGSIRITQSLYTTLLAGLDSQESALLGARNELAKDATHREWASVQLYARDADGADSRPIVFRPYPGLSAFGNEQRRFYFGREELTEKLWNRCQELVSMSGATRLLAVLGPSGSGKSSVAQAGLLAEIQRRSLTFAHQKSGSVPTRVAILKPGAHPLAALQAALPAEKTDESLVVLIDQFEEIYTLCTDAAERSAFVERLLTDASTPGRPILVVPTLRTDFIGETQRQHPKLNRLFDEQSKLVTAMSPDELRRSIAEPAARVGRPIDDATVELLLTEAQGRDGALPLLEFALSQIWEGTLANKKPADTLREIGGVGGALAGKAQEIYGALSKEEKATARRALVRLVRLGEGTRDTRRRVSIGELCGRGETEAAVLSVLRKFATEHARLVTLSSDGTETLAEVTHEALFDHWAELHIWIDQSRKDRGLHDRASDAAKRWSTDGRPAGRLWRTPDLELLRDYQRRKPEELNQLLGEFLAAAVRQQKQEKLLRVGAIMTVFAAVFIGSGVYALERAVTAEKNRQLLDTYVEQGRQLLFEKENPSEAILWLHRAQAKGSSNPALPDLLQDARYHVGAPRTLLIGHLSSINSATYSPDGKRIVTASYDTTARVWDAETGRLVAWLTGHEENVYSATYRPDGKRIVTASDDHTARVWDAETGRLVAVLTGHEDSVVRARYSPNGNRIVTASMDRTARVWDAETGRLVAKLAGHGGSVNSATYSPDGKHIVTTSYDKMAHVWEAEAGRLVVVLKGHSGGVLSATYSPDGKHIVTASNDATARVWEAETGRLVAELAGHGASVHSATYSPDGKHIVTASDDATARTWGADTGRLVAELAGHRASVHSATYSPDGKHIVTTSYDKTARVWDAETGRLVTVLAGHGDRVHSAAYSPDGKRIVTANWDSTARVWEAERGRMVAELTGHELGVRSATYSPDGKRIVTASKDTTARVWEAETGRMVAELAGHGHIVRSATYSPDGKRIVTASWDSTARVWDAETGRTVAELKGHSGGVNSATYSPDGKRIVTTSRDKTARVWDAETGHQVAELTGHEDSVLSATYSPDGKRIVTASLSIEARVWDAETGRQVAELAGHADSVNSATYSPDGKHIVTASRDSTARVWDAETLRLVAELAGHGSSVNSAMYSPDSQRIVTASDDHTARVWEVETGRPVAELTGHGDKVLSATYSPDGKRIVTASDDTTARVWNISPELQPADQLAKLIRCKAAARFEREDGNIIVPDWHNLAECMPSPQLTP